MIRWLKDYWKMLPLAVVALFLLIVGAAAVITGGKIDEIEVDLLDAELKAIDARRRARELESKHGLDKALAAVDAEHADVLKQIDDVAKAELADLRGDPAKYSEHLVRTARNLRNRRTGS